MAKPTSQYSDKRDNDSEDSTIEKMCFELVRNRTWQNMVGEIGSNGVEELSLA